VCAKAQQPAKDGVAAFPKCIKAVQGSKPECATPHDEMNMKIFEARFGV
jgi:hypothetical protein